ncbi:acyltransferase family protein [Bradyrhizobium erythrophlei]|uniref:acyltransferase family protein n=1 Tax=Bradyrhizobium erythrophlei TaxID=1437360 RepID=UPI001FD9B646|nr:acyltransferase [Bradyrhizobium erythrophlei]
MFVHHFVITHRYLQSGIWDYPPSAFYTLLGQVGFGGFFMITGFLFWGKLLDARGRPDWWTLYLGRVFRIGPMYVLVVVLMLFVVAYRTGFQLREPLATVCISVSEWLALGVFPQQPEVNGYQATGLILAGVTWTIFCEWAFYAVLPLLAIIARSRRHALFVGIGLGACLLTSACEPTLTAGLATPMTAGLVMGIVADLLAFFLSGMLVASLRRTSMRECMPAGWLSPIALGCLGTIFVGFDTALGSVQIALMALFFYAVCKGGTLFGLLTTPAARRLGNVSYSVYLMQGIVLTAAFAVPSIKIFALQGVFEYWAVGVLSALALASVSATTYLAVEKPGMAFGRRIRHRFGGFSAMPRTGSR